MGALNNYIKTPAGPSAPDPAAQAAQARSRENANNAGYAAGARRGSSPNGNWEYAANIYDQNAGDYDPDLYRAAILQRYLQGEGGLQNNVRDYAGDLNTDVASSAMQKYLARASQRGELKHQLGSLSGMQADEEAMLKREATQGVDQGIKQTRQNYNQRGLLYSGMRQGGEQQVRAQGAAQLESAIAGTRRDYQNRGDATKKAIAQLGMASEQEALDRANQVFETGMKNSIARQQAFQQLGSGVGYAAGAYYGSRDKAPTQPSGPSGFEDGYAGTGASDGFGGSQMDARYLDTSRTA